jgi:two-component system response regulator HydG
VLEMTRQDDSAVETAQKHRAGRSILYIGGNISFHSVVRTFLERLGYRVHTVCTGKEAVQAVREQQFDVIVMDMGVPIDDDLGVYQRIRGVRPTATIMTMASSATKEIAGHAMAGAA